MVTDKSVSHTLEVRDSLNQLLSAVLGAENGRRGYLMTGDSQYQLQFENSLAMLTECLPEDSSLIGDKACDSSTLRQGAGAKGIKTCIPARSNPPRQFRWTSRFRCFI